jgi:hypothetical protein
MPPRLASACGVDGSPVARHAAIVARSVAERLAWLILVDARPTPPLIDAVSASHRHSPPPTSPVAP